MFSPNWPHPGHGLHDLLPELIQYPSCSSLQTNLPKLPSPSVCIRYNYFTLPWNKVQWLPMVLAIFQMLLLWHVGKSVLLNYLECLLEMQILGGFSTPTDSAFEGVKSRNLHSTKVLSVFLCILKTERFFKGKSKPL